jgi:hypothetical protein
MISNLISYFISSRLQKEPIYEALLRQDGIHLPAGARERVESPPVILGAHPPDEILSATDTVEQDLKTIHPEISAWPVVDENLLLGMVTRPQLEEAMRLGRGSGKIRDLFPRRCSGCPDCDGGLGRLSQLFLPSPAERQVPAVLQARQ